MKVAIYSALLLVVIGVSSVSSQQQLVCHGREPELCLATFLFHFQSSGIPDDDEKVTEWCDIMTEVSECGGNYTSKCLTPTQRELIGLLAGGGASDAQTEFCTPGSELRKNFLKHGACLRKGYESDTFKVHIKDAQVTVETTLDAPFKDRIPTLCCGYRRLLKGAVDTTKKICGDDAVDLMDMVLKMVISDVFDNICKGYGPESADCHTLLPPSGTQPKGQQSKYQSAKLLDTVFGR